MTHAKLTLLSVFLLLLTTPLFSKSSTLVLGFPAWSLFTLIASLTYAIVIAYLLGKHWSIPSDNSET